MLEPNRRTLLLQGQYEKNLLCLANIIRVSVTILRLLFINNTTKLLVYVKHVRIMISNF